MPHDDLCPHTVPWPPQIRCDMCDLIVRVRADERERMLSSVQWRHSVGDPSWSVECLTDNDADCPGCMCTCHAEAVAAKLVEVICEQERRVPFLGLALRQMRAERDAARAEVAALRERYTVEEFIDTDGYPSMRVVKGEQVGENEWAASIRREVLADLRAKVEGMRDEAKADPVGSAVWRTTAYESVLALIEEAQND